MFIYEAKNIIYDGEPVNGLIVKSTDKTDDLLPAKEGDSCSLLFPYFGSNNRLGVQFVEEYTVQYNKTANEPADLKLFAYQGTIEGYIDPSTEKHSYNGVVFKAVRTTDEMTEAKMDDTVVIFAECVDGEKLDTTTIYTIALESSDE